MALDYKRDIMPIFKEKCFDCHSSEAKKVKGGLRLDDEEGFLRRFSKNDVVVPGDWDASYLFVTLVMDRHEKGAMPPQGKGEPLTEKEIMDVAQWIHEGAKIAGQKGEKGDQEMLPEKILKFQNGRLLKEGQHPMPIVPEPVWDEWTNAQGRKITARFLWAKSNKVGLELKNGKKVDYPIEQLSKQSQELIKKYLGAEMKMQ